MAELHAPDAEPDSELERRGNPACWGWPLPELSHLHNAPDALEVEEEATQALRDWQAGRCAMCGEVQSLRTDHDHKTALVRGLLCHGCNILEGVQHGADTPLGRYRGRCPAIILRTRIRYYDEYLSRYAEPEDEEATSARSDLASKNSGIPKTSCRIHSTSTPSS